MGAERPLRRGEGPAQMGKIWHFGEGLGPYLRLAPRPHSPHPPNAQMGQKMNRWGGHLVP
eukprot:3753550-Prymnesium_polylepis.1